MKKAYLFYNPLAGDGKILEDLDALEFVLDEDCVHCDMTRPETYEETLFTMGKEDILVLCGGDGTLSRFVNLTGELQRNNDILYYPAGQNNDFARGRNRYYGCRPFPVSAMLQNLPRVRMGNREGRFLTGIYFAPNRKIRRTSREPSAYNTPRTVTVTLDGAEHTYEKVSFAAVMYGKYCGGGMAPDPDRKPVDTDLSCVLLHGCGKWQTRYLLSQMRKGRKVTSQYLTIHRGRNIRVVFDAPVQLSADGEVQRDISEFSASFTP